MLLFSQHNVSIIDIIHPILQEMEGIIKSGYIFRLFIIFLP